MATTLEQLVERIEGIEQRLTALEAAGATAPVAPPPMPVYEPPAYERTDKRYRPVEVDRPVPKEEADAEYFFGAQVLPRVGAAVLVLAIGFLVSMAISRGLLGPWSQFGLAIAVCLGLIGVGQWKRDEREQFGEVMTGTGVAGLYVAFAAGHAYQALYAGEILVAQFLLLSFANLAYSLWRKSPAFLALGVLGGFSAAVMPLRNDAFLTTSVLYATILSVATFVASRNRWSGALLSVFATAFCVALGLAFGKTTSVPYGVAMIYLSSLALVVGWHRIRPTEEGPLASSACAAIFLFVAPGFAYGAYDGMPGTLHVLGATAVLALVVGWLFKPSERRNFLWTGLVLAAVVYAPIGLPTPYSLFAYPVLALVAAGLAARLGVYAAGLGAVAFASGVVRYVAYLLALPAWSGLETPYLVATAVAAISLGIATRTREGEAIGWTAALAALGRLGWLQLVGSMRMEMNEAVTVLMIALSLAFMALGFARKLAELRYLSFAGLAATVAKVLLIDLATTDPMVRVAILTVLGLVLVGGGYVYIWQRRSQERTRSV